MWSTVVLIVVAGPVLVCVAALVWAIAAYNGLVRRRNLVAEAWSGIDAQLKRRADLIPNLVETVTGYASHERQTFEDLARVRAARPAQRDVGARAQAEQALSAMIGRALAVAEAYPELKASANFQSLQADLADVEDQIQLARRYYNGAVRDLNVDIEQFPSSLVANAGGFVGAPFFEIDNPADRAAPKVTFSR